ncbi:transcriptional regulator YcnK [Desmospora sp. 8437]|nr:transcriptional regulator YcnK [Desmospora sp. 8437]
MLPTERRERIRELIREGRHVKISDLSRALGVSEMTIYRDLKPILEEGWVKKTYGGVTLVGEESPASDPGCVYCGRKPGSRLAYRLVLQGQRMETACCCHCGLLRHSQVKGQVAQAICRDFISHVTISALRAWYVLDPEVYIGCCRPQVLSFEQREVAGRFIRGFGGSLLSFPEAIQQLTQKMEQEKYRGCENS